MIVGKFDVVLPALIRATEITPSTASWARTRKEALCSILHLVDTVGIKTDGKGNMGWLFNFCWFLVVEIWSIIME